jgi:multiple sugar transport system ATP-binding protein
MNLVEAVIQGDTLSFASFSLPLPHDRDVAAYRGKRLILGIRPSDLEDADVWHRETLPVVDVVPELREDLGSEVHVTFTVDAPPVVTEDTVAASAATEEATVDDQLFVSAGRNAFVATVDARTMAQAGRPMRLSVDPERFHFFDKESGLAVGTPRNVTAPV